MAAASRDAREGAGRDASPLALRQVFDQRCGLARRDHLDCYRGVAYRAGRPAQTVADAWVVRDAARWDAGRCRELCQGAVRDCRWASVAGEELGFVLPHRARRPRDVRKQVASRGAQRGPLEERQDGLPRVGPQEHRAEWDALEQALEQQQRVARKRPQGQLA